MKPGAFEYADPATVDEALSLLAERGDEAKVLAGGQSLVPLLNMRLAMPDLLIDINGIAGQDTLETNGKLTIGPLVRQNDIMRARGLTDDYPLLAEAIPWVGHTQIRNRGTVLGSLAHADPAAELPVVWQALEGLLVIAGPRGIRTVPAHDFFVHIMTTTVEPDELLVLAHVNPISRNTGTAFLEIARRHGDFAVASVAVVLAVNGGQCSSAQIALGGVGPVPVRATSAEDFLEGQTAGSEAFSEAARIASSEAEPNSDIHGTADYRRDLIRVLVRRALVTAASRAQARSAAT